MSRGRISCFSKEVNSKTALHDGDRTAKIEFAAPSYLRNIVVIISELGLRYKKELLPMKKEQVDLENGWYISRNRRQRTGLAICR